MKDLFKRNSDGTNTLVIDRMLALRNISGVATGVMIGLAIGLVAPDIIAVVGILIFSVTFGGVVMMLLDLKLEKKDEKEVPNATKKLPANGAKKLPAKGKLPKVSERISVPSNGSQPRSRPRAHRQ